MALPIYLAMTPGEFQGCQTLPEHLGWMACHFSAYAQGLSNMPHSLPSQSLLFVDDQLPPQEHDKNRILQQLCGAAEQFDLRGIVFDFQRSYLPELAELLETVKTGLPCPYAVTPQYAVENAAIFLPPVPCHVVPQQYLEKWKGWPIWLELENLGATLTVTDQGCQVSEGADPEGRVLFHEPRLHCHYTVLAQPERAVFTLHRTREDTHGLLDALGVELAVGLYQQFR